MIEKLKFRVRREYDVNDVWKIKRKVNEIIGLINLKEGESGVADEGGFGEKPKLNVQVSDEARPAANSLKCKRCGKDIKGHIVIKTNALTLSEYMGLANETKYKGMCFDCAVNDKDGDKK